MTLPGFARVRPGPVRYFASRDELLAAMAAESYEALTDALAEAGMRARQRGPADRVQSVAQAFRTWGLTHPHRYRLVFGHSSGSGALDPDRIIPAADRAMTVLLAALADAGAGAGAGQDDLATNPALREQLERWNTARDRAQHYDLPVLALSLLTWTRMHGIVSLEIEGFFDQVGVDPGALYTTEIGHLIAPARLR